MSFQDLHLDVSYESDSNKNQLLDNFYIPVLENSKNTSESLAFLVRHRFLLRQRELKA